MGGPRRGCRVALAALAALATVLLIASLHAGGLGALLPSLPALQLDQRPAPAVAARSRSAPPLADAFPGDAARSLEPRLSPAWLALPALAIAAAARAGLARGERQGGDGAARSPAAEWPGPGLELQCSRRVALALGTVAAPVGPAAALIAQSEAPFFDQDSTVYQIDEARKCVAKFLADADTYEAMMTAGLRTDTMPLPPQIMYSGFQLLANRTREPETFLQTAEVYTEAARDAADNVELAARVLRKPQDECSPELRKAFVAGYFVRTVTAVKTCGAALERMSPLLPEVTRIAST